MLQPDLDQPDRQISPALLEAPWAQRRHDAATAAHMAKSMERLRREGRALGVPFPHNPNPTSLLRWADDLQRANGTEAR